MRASVIGAGGIGSGIGAYLARAGHEVTLVFKHKDEASAVRANGLHVTGVQTFAVQVNVVEWPDPIPPSDLLVVAVKTYDTREALRSALGTSVKMALSAQNGLQKEEMLAEFFGQGRVIGAVMQVTATNQGKGNIFNPDVSLSHIGELDGRPSLRIRELAHILTEAGILTEPTSEIRSIEWTKTCQWIATSLLSVMSGYPYSLIFSTDWLSPLFVEIVRECAAVACADGAHIVETPSLFVNRLIDSPTDKACAWLQEKGRHLAAAWGARYKASMLLDVERRSKTEFDDVVGYVLRKARERKIETPALDFAIRQARNHVGSRLGIDG
ncbi:MAG TPA: 2-dehydropantoate 2-reductase [Chthonomonas sp.]|uniref:ketopantoate reductase family protein n=1 Tax=Chthonomonas sp. TaxID=2282153 RepID=UPI002B4B92EB|nr:2-dehydropantoate 2-reductase [Chthonomonas sp.]HLH79688.1 2-dehydropantoate 2-reductase [Chthonomonas sp.]